MTKKTDAEQNGKCYQVAKKKEKTLVILKIIYKTWEQQGERKIEDLFKWVVYLS